MKKVHNVVIAGLMLLAILLAACDSESMKILVATKVLAWIVLAAICYLGKRWKETD